MYGVGFWARASVWYQTKDLRHLEELLHRQGVHREQHCAGIAFSERFDRETMTFRAFDVGINARVCGLECRADALGLMGYTSASKLY